MKKLQQRHKFEIPHKMATKKNGFVLILVITALALIGTEMFVLTGLTKTLLFESDTAYLQALERDLVASGLAWAGRNIKNQNKETFNTTTELDIANMSVRRASLSVTIAVPDDKEAQVQISTLSARGTRTLRHDNKYHIQLR